MLWKKNRNNFSDLPVITFSPECTGIFRALSCNFFFKLYCQTTLHNMMIKYAGLSTMSIVDEVFVSAWEWLIILYFWESTTDIWCGFTLPMRTAGVQRWTGRNVLTFANSTAIYVKKTFRTCSAVWCFSCGELSCLLSGWIGFDFASPAVAAHSFAQGTHMYACPALHAVKQDCLVAQTYSWAKPLTFPRRTVTKGFWLP